MFVLYSTSLLLVKTTLLGLYIVALVRSTLIITKVIYLYLDITINYLLPCENYCLPREVCAQARRVRGRLVG